MDRKELQIHIPKLKLRIPYDEDIFKTNVLWEQILTSLLEDSKAICLETLSALCGLVGFSNLIETAIKKQEFILGLKPVVAKEESFINN